MDSNIAHKSYLVNTSWSLRFKPKLFRMDDNTSCSCLTSNTCMRPQGFFCQSTSCQLVAYFPNQTVPGLRISFFPVNSVLLSTLECFYNASCIQMLLDWRLFEIADVYRPFVLNVTPLNPNLPIQYKPTTTLDVAISRLLVEDWNVKTSVAAHYDQCKPSICTYTYVARLGPFYVATSVLGLLGGLSVVLRLTVPVFVRIIMHKVQRRHPLVNAERSERTSTTNEQNHYQIDFPDISTVQSYILSVHFSCSALCASSYYLATVSIPTYSRQHHWPRCLRCTSEPFFVGHVDVPFSPCHHILHYSARLCHQPTDYGSHRPTPVGIHFRSSSSSSQPFVSMQPKFHFIQLISQRLRTI
jgi:hypothetical protein